MQSTKEMNQKVIDEFNGIKTEFNTIKGSIVALANFLRETTNEDANASAVKNDIINNFNDTISRLIREYAIEKSKPFVDSVEEFLHKFIDNIKSNERINTEIDNCVKKYIKENEKRKKAHQR